MSNLNAKVKELAHELLSSEESIRYADARAAFEADAEAVRLYDEYAKTYAPDVITKLKEMPIVMEYIQLKQQYENLVATTMADLKIALGQGGAGGCGCGCGSKGC